MLHETNRRGNVPSTRQADMFPAFDAAAMASMKPREPQRRPHSSKATSLAAYRDGRPRAGTKAAIALNAIIEAGKAGLTRYETCESTGIGYCSIAAPVLALLNAGLIVELAATRPTPTGSPAHVLVAKEALR
ncbi:hypothetical protein [Rosistilla oblonga]|uniref:Uncharacterized protein n=1 Tax=Rosistilla oblonga TaxID=2527990 RepID=A0A518IQX2_9BACT|nr:hypothetical protein [Rosistilla oblonga]QDV55484.1 hypothetical protein Mal33_14590 [Rosistilla oblonga]